MNSKPVRHNEFYMESIVFLVRFHCSKVIGTTTHFIFQVEDTLFKVPRFPFEHNGIFATIFTLPPGQNTVVEGCSDKHPFKLEGVNKNEFQTFLRVLYPRSAPLILPTTVG